MAPVQGGAHGALAGRQVARARLEGGVEAGKQGVRVEQPGAGRGELEGKRQAGEPLAGRGDGGCLGGALRPTPG